MHLNFGAKKSPYSVRLRNGSRACKLIKAFKKLVKQATLSNES